MESKSKEQLPDGTRPKGQQNSRCSSTTKRRTTLPLMRKRLDQMTLLLETRPQNCQVQFRQSRNRMSTAVLSSVRDRKITSWSAVSNSTTAASVRKLRLDQWQQDLPTPDFLSYGNTIILSHVRTLSPFLWEQSTSLCPFVYPSFNEHTI
jgi:hypothetical protein